MKVYFCCFVPLKLDLLFSQKRNPLWLMRLVNSPLSKSLKKVWTKKERKKAEIFWHTIEKDRPAYGAIDIKHSGRRVE